MYYELHVTMNQDPNAPHPITLSQICPDASFVWKSSHIDGDPDLGEGVRYYRTAKCKTLKQAMIAITLAKRRWPYASRFKIEMVVYDVRRKPQYSRYVKVSSDATNQ